MRNKILMSLLTFALLAPAAGCFVRTGPSHRHHHARSCGPAYHWENGRCVHNGRAHGHNKVKVRDHR